MTALVCLLAALAATAACRRSQPQPDTGPTPADPPTAIAADRPVYKYSVIPGGVQTAADLTRATALDEVVARHYDDVEVAAVKAAVLTSDRHAYVSYRRGDRIYWTKRPVKISAGETILTDGAHEIRGRCGNRISMEPLLPTAEDEPNLVELDALLPPAATNGAPLNSTSELLGVPPLSFGTELDNAMFGSRQSPLAGPVDGRPYGGGGFGLPGGIGAASGRVPPSSTEGEHGTPGDIPGSNHGDSNGGAAPPTVAPPNGPNGPSDNTPPTGNVPGTGNTPSSGDVPHTGEATAPALGPPTGGGPGPDSPFGPDRDPPGLTDDDSSDTWPPGDGDGWGPADSEPQPTPVPEPGTLIMMLGGLGLGARYLRRRRRS